MKNIVVDKMENLLKEKENLELKYKTLQRKRDLEVDTINKAYSNQIASVLRKYEAVKDKIDQVKKYANKNLEVKEIDCNE